MSDRCGDSPVRSPERGDSPGRSPERGGASSGRLADACSRLTERRNPRSAAIDTMSARELVDLINSEDREVAPAVAAERDSIAEAVHLVVDRFNRGGRLIYVGAGTSGRL
ncbi:MAG: hypothetical protein JXB46_00735, partial [Candidatus Eisenbacteria bacterium]|nr:hypothetical protein [Candidatus Eisenbacteria bacterium]